MSDFTVITPSLSKIKTGTPIVKIGNQYIVAGIGGDFIPTGTGVTVRGVWKSDSLYFLHDMVTRLGSSYLALDTTYGIPPESSDSRWLLYVSKGDSAGVGTPTHSVTTLNASDSASVSVTATGPDTAKVFNFHFGIPRGVASGFGTPIAEAHSLDPLLSASATVLASGEDTAKIFSFSFGIPRGLRGLAFKIGAVGSDSQLHQYDSESHGFIYLADDKGWVYIKNSNLTGVWSRPVPVQGDSAGFGTPFAGVHELGQSDSASVVLTASGPDTAKIFNFLFGIPRGKAAGIALPIVHTETLDPSDSASVTIVSSGPDTAKQFEFSFGIPKGYSAGFDAPTVVANTLAPSDSATVSIIADGPDTKKLFQFTFGIPRGYKGDAFKIDQIGPFELLHQYDDQPKGFSYLAEDNNCVYIRKSDTAGEWAGPFNVQGLAAGFGTPTVLTHTLSASDSASVIVTTDASSPSTAKIFNFQFGIPKGKTGDAAGFGIPTAEAHSLSADQDASVSITASGEDTSKVFHFNFGLPRGKNAGIAGTTVQTTTLTLSDSASVTVTTTGLDTAKVFNFQFSIPRGRTGAGGDYWVYRQENGDTTALVSQWLSLTANCTVTLPPVTAAQHIKISTANTASDVLIKPASGLSIVLDPSTSTLLGIRIDRTWCSILLYGMSDGWHVWFIDHGSLQV